MGTASIHEGVRRMRFSDLLDRTETKALTQVAASELLGINVRTFQRWAERYEAEGDDGLIDRRMGRRSRGRGAGSLALLERRSPPLSLWLSISPWTGLETDRCTASKVPPAIPIQLFRCSALSE